MAEIIGKQSKRGFQFPLPRFILTSFLLIFLFLFSSNAHAQCDQDFGAGEAFYNFKKIIIKYALFPSESEQKRTNYPVELTEKNFSERLIGVIQKNFSKCLQDKKIPIVISPPSSPITEHTDIHDDDNLSLIVRVSYGMDWTGPQGIQYGTLHFFWYRPDTEYKHARIPLSNNSGTLAFFPGQIGKPLEEQLDKFLSATLKPASTSTGPSYVVIERK